MPTPKDNSSEREASFADLYRFYGSYIRSYRGTLALACLFLFGAVLMEVARPWPLKIVFDYVLRTSGRPRHGVPWLAGLDPMTVLLVACAIVIAVAIGFGMFEYAHTVLVAKVGQKVVFKIRERLFMHVQRLSLSFHSRNRSGDLLSRLIRDVNQLRDFLSDSAVQWIGETVFVTGMIAVMLWLDWRLALLSLALFPLLVLSISRYSGQIRGLTRRRLKKEGSVASIFNETLAAIQEVQLFTPEGEENRRFSDENRSSYKAEMRAFRTKSKLMRAVELLTAAGTCVVLWYGARRVVDGQLSAGDLLVFLAYLKSLYKPVRRIANLSVQASKAFASAERVMQILRTVPEIRDAPDAISAPRLRGELEFRGLEFEYEPGRPVLSGIDLRVPAGQTVAVVGSSGAGKSTLVSLIPRLYDPTAGAVLIDGVDIRRYKLASLRDQITVVPQDPVLFGSTIRENIAMGNPSCDFQEIQRATRLACAEEFIDRLPHGYDTELGERASNLSGGQRQRIAVARALLRDAPIVILDEPMTGLDIFSETLVLRGLRNLLRDRTAFVIAHRLSTILKSDLVIVVENGRIVESGSPQQLIQANGPFRKLAELQFGAVNVERMLMPVYGGWAHGA